MNDFNIGIDIVKNSRLNKPKLIKHFLTENEYSKFQSFLDDKRKIEYVSGIWAAKEAIIKASFKNINWKSIEIVSDGQGRPIVKINDKIEGKIKLSISHERKYTVACCVLIKE